MLPNNFDGTPQTLTTGTNHGSTQLVQQRPRRFLELAAKALKDPLLGFRLARDGDLRQMGLLYYAAASSQTLVEALDRVQRYSSIVNSGVVLQCIEAVNFTIALRYAGVARHYDRQQMGDGGDPRL